MRRMTTSQLLRRTFSCHGLNRARSRLAGSLHLNFRRASQASPFAKHHSAASNCLAPSEDGAPGTSDVSVSAPRPLQSREAVAEYVRQQPLLRDLLGISAPGTAVESDNVDTNDSEGSDGDLSVAELSGGRINFVWRVRGPGGAVVLKHAAPFVRSIGPEFPLSQTRLGVEADAMAAAHAACPQHVPALLLYDAVASVLVQDLVSGPQGRCRVKLVGALAAAPPPPCLAGDLASLLAAYLLRNSVYELPYEQHAAAAKRLRNSEVVAANSAVVFTDPWAAGCPRNRVPPGLEEEVAWLRGDTAVRQEVSRLLHEYRSSVETLIHNDLTAGNILVSEPPPQQSDATPSFGDAYGMHDVGGMYNRESACDTHLIDWEFATYGPMAYDIGSLLGNLLLSYCATCSEVAAQPTVAAAASMGTRASPSAPLLRCILELWEELEARIQSYTPARHACSAGGGAGALHGGGGATAGPQGDPREGEGEMDEGREGALSSQRLLADSLGYAGCVVARLVFGMHHYPALEAIPCSRRRRACQRLALRLAAALLRPEERQARGWQGGGRGGGRTVREEDSSGGIRQLVRDLEKWAAVEAQVEARGG